MGADGLAVLDAQNVVGRAQQRAKARFQRFGRRGAGGGVRHAGGQVLAHQRLQRLALQHAGRMQQLRGVRRFGPKGQRVAPQRRQQGDAGGGELFGRGAGVGRGQRHDKVRPGCQRRAHAHTFRQNGRAAALHRAAAEADGDAPRPRPAHGGQLGRVPVVEGIVLGNDAGKLHIAPCRCAKNV